MPAGELAKRHREQLFLPHQAASVGEQAQATADDNVWFDLRAFAHLLLRSAGVPEENMEWLGSCTYCTPQLLGSFRRRTHFPAPKSFQYSWIMREPDSAGR